MALIFDPVSDAVDKFMVRRGSAVVESAIRAALGLSNRIEMLGPDAPQLNCEAVASTLDRVHSLGTELCARNSFGRLLLLFRKVRHEVTIPLFQQWYSASTKEIGTLLEQATIYGTNAILQFARHDDDVFVDYSARYRLQPEAEEMSDALRLVVYAVVHRHLMFIANTDARRPLGYEVSFEALINSYNSRQAQRRSQRFVKATGSGRILVIPAFVFNIPPPRRTIRVQLAKGETREIAHRNYFPVERDFDAASAQYDYLNTNVFTDLWGMEYGKWKLLWAALNSLLSDSIISLWTSEMALSVPVEQASAAAERADDYSDTCFGTPIVESLMTGCIEVVEQRFREHACTREDVSRFIDGLTMKGPFDDVNFVEQPILFYDIGHGKVVWDYLRHGALIRAFARKTVAHQHRLKTGDSSGPGFEKYIAERLSNAIPDIKDLKRNVIIRDRGRKAWEIDVSFVLNEVLFIVEAKHYQKSVKYHAADGSEVAERIQSWESECRERDRRLTTYQQHVRRKWDGSTLLGAICIICTEETEFVASAERKYWLNFPDIPRICTIDEFIEFLNDGGAKSVTDHPAFSPFREER